LHIRAQENEQRARATLARQDERSGLMQPGTTRARHFQMVLLYLSIRFEVLGMVPFLNAGSLSTICN
jgi:hypothetical protein